MIQAKIWLRICGAVLLGALVSFVFAVGIVWVILTMM